MASRPSVVSAPRYPIVKKVMAAAGRLEVSRSSSLTATRPDQLRNGLAWRLLAYLVMIAALALVSTLPLVDWLKDATWHDQQRIGQTLAMALTLVGATIAFGPGGLCPPLLLDTGRRRLVALVIAAAIVSACLARQPLWGLSEVALGVGSLGVAWVVATMRRLHGATVDRVLLAVLFFTCSGLMARFVAAYLSAVVGGEGLLNAWLLVDGFSNPRFYGQFLTLGLPLLLVPVLAAGRLRRYALAAGALTVLAWVAAITSGTRGTWLGLALATILLRWAGMAGRRWARLQIAAAVLGAVLFWIAMTVVPRVLDIRIEHHAASRLTGSLSQRDILWQQAVEVAIQNPLLGIGPMQLADRPNGLAAHPHQAWLQWAAELGVPSALLVTWLVACGAWALARVLRARGGSTQEQDVVRLCLTGAIAAGLAQAMVDGVLVMPYSQLWVALLAGWLVGLQPPVAPADPLASATRRASQGSLPVWLAVIAASVTVLGSVVVRDYPHLAEREQVFVQSFGGRFQPRFWAQGVIRPYRGDASPHSPVRDPSR